MKLCRLGEIGKEKPAIIDKENSYSESGIIDRKTGELIHEITRNIKTENSEKDISFYLCSKKNEKV